MLTVVEESAGRNVDRQTQAGLDTVAVGGPQNDVLRQSQPTLRIAPAPFTGCPRIPNDGAADTDRSLLATGIRGLDIGEP